jgi:hypothetical protein
MVIFSVEGTEMLQASPKGTASPVERFACSVAKGHVSFPWGGVKKETGSLSVHYVLILTLIKGTSP